MSTPSTNINICSWVALNSTYHDSIYFENPSDQLEFFSGKIVKRLTAYSFVRRTWTLKVEGDMCEALTWNYLFFNYPNDHRYYYYFINHVEYVNDSTVELTLELDLLQTYLFRVAFNHCLIEREHVRDDTFGKHTVDEGLDAGEYLYRKSAVLFDFYNSGTTIDNMAILILSSFNPQQVTSPNNAVSFGGIYGNVYSGLGLYAVPLNKANHLSNKINNTLAELNLIDGIFAMWVYPKSMIRLAGEQSWDNDLWCYNVLDVKWVYDDFQPVKNFTSNYTPKNNKLLCYPYNVISVDNGMGQSSTYRLEYFSDKESITFCLEGALSPDAGLRCRPSSSYLNANTTTNEQILSNHSVYLPPYPLCAWNSDTYKIWVSQNQHSIDSQKRSSIIQYIGGAVSVIGGAVMTATGVGAPAGLALMGGGAATIANAANNHQEAVKTEQSAENQADQMRGSFNPSITYANDTHCFNIAQKQITVERAKIIDGYFDLYGYKVNRVGAPSLKNRERYTYVKTSGCTVQGELCNEDCVKIGAIFDKGITWWVNGNDLGMFNLGTNRPLDNI